jgi:hypothetical protein
LVRLLLKLEAKEEDMVQKVVALALLLVLPMVFTIISGPAAPAYAYVFAKEGMSDEELLLWSVAAAALCSLAFTGIAALGCAVTAAG